MDQAENLRNIIKKQNQKDLSNARVIAVTSGKGGVGKSSVSINLAVQFTKMGKKVIILDADFGLANIEVMFGVIPKYNLSDLMVSGREISEIITEGPEGIKFISGGSGIAKLVNPDCLRACNKKFHNRRRNSSSSINYYTFFLWHFKFFRQFSCLVKMFQFIFINHGNASFYGAFQSVIFSSLEFLKIGRASCRERV